MHAFAAGVRTLFRDPNLGVAGVYTPPGGPAVPLRVLRVSATDRVAGSIATFAGQAAHDQAELQQADVPIRPAKGATLAFDGRVRGVSSTAPGRNGLTWLLVLADG